MIPEVLLTCKPYFNGKNKPYRLAIFLFLLSFYVFGGETHTVINNHDYGEGSFRYFVNLASDDDSIQFAEPFIIALDSQINIVGKSIWIDGLVGQQKVQLNGKGKTRAMNVQGDAEKFIYIRNLEIADCFADYGGGMKTFCLYDYCEVIIENVDFKRNIASIRGGAATFSGVVVRGCMFFANQSALDGGAIFANESQFINCMFLGNLCTERGSVGVFNNGIEVVNCSFVMNEPDLFYSVHTPRFYNSLFWNEFPLMRSAYNAEFNACVTNGWRETNIPILEESPFVATPDAGEDTIWGTWDDEIDLRMKYGNYCINKGNFHVELNAVSKDFLGGFRIIGDTIDIGAIEYDPEHTDSDNDGVMDAYDADPLDPAVQ